MSRQELADAVNTAVYAETGRAVSVDAGYIGKLERGEHRWPYAHTRAALRTVLDAETDAELGFFIIHGHANDEQPAPEPVPRVPTNSSAPARAVVMPDHASRSPDLGGTAVVQVDVSVGAAVTVVCDDTAPRRVAVVAGGVRVLIDTHGIGSMGDVAAGCDAPMVEGGARVYSLAARRAAAGGSR